MEDAMKQQQTVQDKSKAEQELAGQFVYLDDLRDSGVTNMFGAGPYLADDYGLDKAEARRVLGLWMRTFSKDKSPEERAALALAGGAQ